MSPMTTARASAPAKINLTLHVTGQRPDGYHLIDSLVVFANVADQISASLSPDLTLSVSGPFSQGVPTDESNLVLRAARLLQSARNVPHGAAITLEKHLPHAAGIGSGSSDAAATLDLLARLWDVPALPEGSAEVLALGADVPVCLRAPQPARMAGIGEIVAPVPRLPECAMVLVNPRVPVPTGEVFARMRTKDNAPMDAVPEAMSFDSLAAWLANQRNDMTEEATELAPAIGHALQRLRAMPQVHHAAMSGSGATCYGLVRNMADARQVARAIQVSEMAWWVAPAEVLSAVS